jgi:hypothetical protein
MTSQTLTAVIASWTPVNVNAGTYTCQYFLQDQPTTAASTMFWYRGMVQAQALPAAPATAAITPVTLTGLTQAALLQSLQADVANLVVALTAKYPTAITVPIGYATPVIVNIP